MFESDGQEALSCGNGLLCAAHYLHTVYGVHTAAVVTETPSPNPGVLTIGPAESPGSYRVHMGYPTPVSASLVHPSFVSYSQDFLGVVLNFPVRCQMAVTKSRRQTISIHVSGYLTYTGEPHFVIFTPNELLSSEGPAGLLQTILDDKEARIDDQKFRTNSVWLLHQIGLNFNRKGSSLFPHGLNVDIARVVSRDEGIIEYRCFERGIKKETLACGTGATAIAVVAHRLGMVTTDCIKLRPIRCRWYYPDARQLVIKDSRDTWWLEGEPKLTFSGTAEFPAVIERESRIPAACKLA